MPDSTTSVRIEHDPVHQCVRVLSSFDREDFVEVRHVKTAALHFPRFAQVSAAADVRFQLLALPAASLRVLLVLMLTVDATNGATCTSAAVATETGLARAVVSRALMVLYAHDLLRPTGRTRAGRTWMVSPHLVFRTKAQLSATVMSAWARLPHAPEPAED
jgi:hypothetical protein